MLPRREQALRRRRGRTAPLRDRQHSMRRGRLTRRFLPGKGRGERRRTHGMVGTSLGSYVGAWGTAVGTVGSYAARRHVSVDVNGGPWFGRAGIRAQQGKWRSSSAGTRGSSSVSAAGEPGAAGLRACGAGPAPASASSGVQSRYPTNADSASGTGSSDGLSAAPDGVSVPR